MPERVKCIHVLVGHSLAEGPGANPLGDEALELMQHDFDPEVCRCEGAWDTDGDAPQQTCHVTPADSAAPAKPTPSNMTIPVPDRLPPSMLEQTPCAC